tara:strand:+ start:1517 stop:1735 length:219 start_codon:yes stop_codon:yes gene_type:complete
MLLPLSLILEQFSNFECIGFLVFIIGIIVLAATFYSFYHITNNFDSILDKRRKLKAKNIQEKKIARLYPNSK